MNRKQMALVKRANAEYRKQRNAERRLEKVNQDPRQQHNWDEWVRRSGYVQGLSLGLDFLNEFIRLGSEPALKRGSR